MPEKLTKARKKHRCDYCAEPIMPGDMYDRLSGFGSEGPWVLKQHPECAALTKDWGEDDWHIHSPGDGKRQKASS